MHLPILVQLTVDGGADAVGSNRQLQRYYSVANPDITIAAKYHCQDGRFGTQRALFAIQ